MSEHIQIALRIGAAPQRIFQALTQADQLTHWFAEHADVSEAERRYDFWGRFTPGAPTHAQGQHSIQLWQPDQKLAFVWQLRGAATTVTIGLTPEGDGTRLTLSQEDVPTRRDGEDSIADFWLLSFENLRSWLERGVISTFRDFSTSQKDTLQLAITIDAPPEAVFPALIEPAQLERYIAVRATVEPQIGGRYDFGWGDGPQRILELVPNQTLAYSWSFPGEPDTVVTWELEGSGGRTRLTLVQSGFGPDRTNDDYESGWLSFMVRIKHLAELGAAWQKPTLLREDYTPA
jgi:uncharacterized protein YndB with AHSA1/START domain